MMIYYVKWIDSSTGIQHSDYFTDPGKYDEIIAFPGAVVTVFRQFEFKASDSDPEDNAQDNQQDR